MLSITKTMRKKVMLLTLLGLIIGIAASVADARPRQCRIEHCWDTNFGPICYYDSGWIDC